MNTSKLVNFFTNFPACAGCKSCQLWLARRKDTPSWTLRQQGSLVPCTVHWLVCSGWCACAAVGVLVHTAPASHAAKEVVFECATQRHCMLSVQCLLATQRNCAWTKLHWKVRVPTLTVLLWPCVAANATDKIRALTRRMSSRPWLCHRTSPWHPLGMAAMLAT